MDHTYQQLQSEVRIWNCARIFLLLINIFYLLASLTLIIMGVMAHLFMVISASYLLSYGFCYARYSHYVYIYGLILLPLSCTGIAAVFRQSNKLTKFYTQLLSIVTVIEIVGVIISAALYPFLERAIWNTIQYTIDTCDITSVAYYAIAYVQMSFGCCGLNHPNSLANNNDTQIQTSCYSKDKYTVYDSYCNPERYYKINCFDRVYNDAQEKLFVILISLLVMIAFQCLTIYCAVVHRRNIKRQRNNHAMELATTEDVVVNHYKRRNEF